MNFLREFAVFLVFAALALGVGFALIWMVGAPLGLGARHAWGLALFGIVFGLPIYFNLREAFRPERPEARNYRLGALARAAGMTVSATAVAAWVLVPGLNFWAMLGVFVLGQVVNFVVADWIAR